MEIELPSGSLGVDRVRIMGILNTTPDSFSDGGRYRELERALARAVQMAAEGADIIDIGGEKAGPGEPVSLEEELRRVVPVVAAVKREISLPVSVDTLKPDVARMALDAGADIINSIGGFDDPALRRVAANARAGVIVMHIQGTPRVANPCPVYGDVVEEVRRFLLERAALCVADGIDASRIIIDPGPDFGKTADQTIAVLRNLERLTELPYPVLLAASRKRFIGEMLGTEVDDRLEGSLAVATWGVLQGVRLVRVHDVRATKRIVTMVEAVLNPWEVEAIG
ncbi:MAG TPA: dihydropteroate synthase [Chloroflexota bacterium]